jgi:WD40 repeat protein
MNSHLFSERKYDDECQKNHRIGKCDITFTGHTDWIRCVAILPDGRIVSGSDDQTIKIWC